MMSSNNKRFLGNRPIIPAKKVRKKSEDCEESFPSCIFDDSNKSENSGYLSSTPTKNEHSQVSQKQLTQGKDIKGLFNYILN